MMRRRLLIALFAVAAAAFVFGMNRLLVLRYSAGDAYPPYSTFRADPLGCRALYGAMNALPGVTASRNVTPLTHWEAGAETTLFVAGAMPGPDPDELAGRIEDFCTAGGRFVVTYYPHSRAPRSEGGGAACEGGACPTPEDAEDGDDGENDQKSKEKRPGGLVSIEKRWGVALAYAKRGGDVGETPSLTVRRGGGPRELPTVLPWHSTMYFELEDEEAWTPVYGWDGKTVACERRWGAGSIVLCSDSYLLSNEALREDRHPALLAWLAGPSRRVVFDETHLGAVEQPGTMTLIRRYRLTGLLAVFAVMALLWVWRNASSLVPKRSDDEERPPAALGYGARGGLTNVLRRSVPPRDLLTACLAERKRVDAAAPPRGRARLAEAERVARRAQQEGVRRSEEVAALYRKLCAMLAERGSDRG